VSYIPTGMAKKRLIIPSVARIWTSWNSYTLLLGMKNGTITFENALAVFWVFFLFSVLGFELRTSHLLDRHSYHYTSPFL
jgi:hypothetical protein